MRHLSIEVGLLHRGRVRDYLDSAEFLGLDIEYKELKGFLSTDFIIRGSDESLNAVMKQLEAWTALN